jgi:hypothetical protein
VCVHAHVHAHVSHNTVDGNTVSGLECIQLCSELETVVKIHTLVSCVINGNILEDINAYCKICERFKPTEVRLRFLFITSEP